MTRSGSTHELKRLGTSKIDLEFFRTYVRALEESGFDYTLLGYASNWSDSFIMASAVGQLTERIKPVVALRPNTTFPTVAAQKLSTLDQLTLGRAVVHLISGGNDAEQRRQGDYLPKDRRYARTSEYIDILRRSWTSDVPFDHNGEFYKFEGFGPGFPTYSGEPVPISIGGTTNSPGRRRTSTSGRLRSASRAAVPSTGSARRVHHRTSALSGRSRSRANPSSTTVRCGPEPPL